jgi:hypothetical protein
MIIYEEVVQLRRFMSPLKALAHLGSTAAFAGYLYWSDIYGKNLRAHPFSSVGLVCFIAFEFFPVLLILNAVLFPDFCLQIDDQALLLKRGFVRKKIPLDAIVEVRVVSASRVQKTTIVQKLYRNTDFLFLDKKDLPNVELLLSGGRSRFFATARAPEVGGILRREAERAHREAALKLIAAHYQNNS